MRDTWYGDRADLVKWGTLIHLAQREKLGRVVQIAFLRRGERPPLLTCRGPEEVPKVVWDHSRDPRRITELGERAGVAIDFFDKSLEPRKRTAYVDGALFHLREPTDEAPRGREAKLVLLDPDTGLEPAAGAELQHVTTNEVGKFWEVLAPGDWLVLYQHAPREKKGWRERAADRFGEACGGSCVETSSSEGITPAVAFLAARKP